MGRKTVFSTNRILKWYGLNAFLCIGLTAILPNCNSGNDTFAPPQPRTWFYEREFTQNPSLKAKPDQVVLLSIVPGVASVEHAIPYQFEDGGPYLFAIEPNDPFITRADLYDRNGVRALSVERGDGGAYINLSPGTYTLKVIHDGSDAPSEGTVAFIRLKQADAAEKPGEPAAKAGETGSFINPVYPAFVALQSNSVAPYHYLGTADYQNVPGGGLFSYPISEITSLAHLFSFEPATAVDCNESGSYPAFEGTYRLHSWQGDVFTALLVSCTATPPQCPSNQTKGPEGKTYLPAYDEFREIFVHVEDKNYGFFALWSFVVDGSPCSPIYTDPGNGYAYYTEFQAPPLNPPEQWRIDTSFTFYKDGEQINRSALEKGEVAVYEGAKYTGPAVVLRKSFDTTCLIPMSSIKSVAFGYETDTTVQFFSDEDFDPDSLLVTVGVDTQANLDLSGVNSIYIFDSKQILISSMKCPSCNLAGVDLSNLMLKGANLSYANLMGANLTTANLEGASLLNAFLQGNPDPNPGPAATLSGAYLKDANLKGANLGGVGFLAASFYSSNYSQDGCSQDINHPLFTENCASAEGANLNAAAFTGAYLAGADFSGTTAIAADFTGAILTGAKFTDASLGWDIDTGARTIFVGAFIGGADFTNATVDGANFLNAYVHCDTDGACMLFTISKNNTKFPGFDDSDDSPCVMFAYAGATTTPTTDDTNICPDGSSNGSCGQLCSDWPSPQIPREESSQNNSICRDRSSSWCNQIDTNW